MDMSIFTVSFDKKLPSTFFDFSRHIMQMPHAYPLQDHIAVFIKDIAFCQNTGKYRIKFFDFDPMRAKPVQ